MFNSLTTVEAPLALSAERSPAKDSQDPRDNFSVGKDYVRKPIKLDNIKNKFKIPSDR